MASLNMEHHKDVIASALAWAGTLAGHLMLLNVALQTVAYVGAITVSAITIYKFIKEYRASKAK